MADGLMVTATQPGNYVFEDDGIAGNNMSRIRFPDGSIFVFEHPTVTWELFAFAPGITFTFNITDSLGAASLTVGNLAGAANAPDSIVVKNIASTGAVILVSNGAITEGGSDAAPDIRAASLVLSAATGVGTPANAIETQVAAIEAETPSGGIALVNFGDVTVGGVSGEVSGLAVTNTGNVSFTSYGSIVLFDLTGLDVVHSGFSSGNVNLVASGFDSDVTSLGNQYAINAPGGAISVTAGRDIRFGTDGPFDHDLRANRGVTLTAGRDVILDGYASVESDTFGNGTGQGVTVTAGRNIALLNDVGASNGGGSIYAQGNAGADIILSTGAGGSVTLGGFGLLFSGSGDALVAADRMIFGPSTGILANTGQVTLRPATDGRAMILGSVGDAAFGVELSDTELDTVLSPRLILGGTTAGPISVVSPIAPSFAAALELRSGTDIFVESSLASSASIILRAGDGLFQLAASTIATGSLSVFIDDIGDDANEGGAGALGGIVTATSIVLTGNVDADTLRGSGSDDLMVGGGGNDTLFGFAGADTLNGGLGKDRTEGGPGDDLHIVDSTIDVAFEAVGEGYDTVQSTATYTLGAEIEKLTLAGAADINGNGNDLDNLILGNNGANTLDGKLGADAMRGGLGNDTYIVNNVGDTVTETSAAGGIDLVKCSVTFTLGTNVENLTLSGGAANGTGNTLANVITGNAVGNTLSGAGGADTMIGLGGNDVYVVDNAGDVATEAGAAGTDRIQSSISYALGANLENLTLVGSAANGTGNSLVNIIIGNSAANNLNGDAGGDTLKGGAGGDTLDGGIGNDDLFGGAGNDGMTGGAGVDKFRFDTALSAATNVDDLLDFSVADDSLHLDRLIFTGIAANGGLSAAAFRSGTAAADADDRIVYDAATGSIFYDSDGIGGAAQILFATVDAGTALTRLDFFAYTG